MIRVENLSIQSGSFLLDQISFEVARGEYAVLMGRIGSGKTTLLESLCGLRAIRSGRIWLDDQDVTALPPAQRGIGYVPQDGALFAHLTVREHLTFALEIRGFAAVRVAERSRRLAALLGLEKLLDRRPAGLSGGEAQRVALGRAISFEPRVLLLDEPLSALDDESRVQAYEVLHRVQRAAGVTVLHITHNPAECRRLADRTLRLVDGRVIVESPAPSPPTVNPTPAFHLS